MSEVVEIILLEPPQLVEVITFLVPTPAWGSVLGNINDQEDLIELIAASSPVVGLNQVAFGNSTTGKLTSSDSFTFDGLKLSVGQSPVSWGLVAQIGYNFYVYDNLYGFADRTSIYVGGIQLGNPGGYPLITNPLSLNFEVPSGSITMSAATILTLAAPKFVINSDTKFKYENDKLSIKRTTIDGAIYAENNSYNLGGNGPIVINDGSSGSFSLGYTDTLPYIRQQLGAIYIKGAIGGYGVFVENSNLHINGKVRMGDYALNTGKTLEVVGTIWVNGLPVGNAGLTTGDLYQDTAANILANGDRVVGIKV